MRNLSLNQARHMARGRNYYIEGASANSGLSAETKDLLANVKHSENVEEWQREPGIKDPYKFSQYRQNPLDIDDQSELDMIYYPHKGEEPWPKDYQPSPVLLVKRVKNLKGEPWWHKMDCERIGLGIKSKTGRTIVALPNLSFYNALLYRIKHLIEITPVTFPENLPNPDEFDVRCAKVTSNGTFLYQKSFGADSKNLLGEGPLPINKIKMTEKTHKKESLSAWLKPWNSPYGTSNYERDYTMDKPEKSDFVTDSSNKLKY